MTDRDVPFDPNTPCDNCGTMGAFDFMGDYLCMKCSGGEDNNSSMTALRSALDLCIEALEQVEWLQDHNSYDYCPWCGEYVTLGNAPKHTDDCLRGRALKAARRE